MALDITKKKNNDIEIPTENLYLVFQSNKWMITVLGKPCQPIALTQAERQFYP